MSVRKRNILRLTFILFLAFFLGMNVSCGEQQGKEIQHKTNLPPVITSITISPDPPKKGSELSLSIQSHSPGRNPLTYRYQWIKNDDEISGENRETLKSGNFRKGDLIQVKVIPSDGEVDGNPFLSRLVKISNTPPVVEEVRIEPKLPYANSDLKAVVKSSDADGDSINHLYQWEKNGNVLSGEESGILEPNRFKRGDSITVTVTPNDGETSGRPKKSEAILIQNSPPIIFSSPPTHLTGNTYIYQVKAEDPDNEPIIFALKRAPKRMEIDKETGLIRWEIRKEDQGMQSIEIEVSDSMGAKSYQKYTVTIEMKGK
jgi:hypothetical protein